MTKAIRASKLVEAAGEHPVEAAIREGKIPESRRAHYMGLMAKKPKKTTKLLASLEAVLEPQEEMEGFRQYAQDEGQTAPAGPTASGPTGPSAYITSELQPGEVKRGPVSKRGTITYEDGTAAALSVPGGGL
jgi:hypothetical protein